MSEVKQAHITVKDAISIAKTHVAELFAPDNIRNVGLEEVEFDEAANAWNITVGFSRPWDSISYPENFVPLNINFPESAPRTYKIAAVSADTGRVLKVVHRQI